MKLANWFAVLSCLGVAGGVALASQGCTTTITAGTGGGDDDVLGDDDSGIVQEDAGSTPASPCLDCLYGQCGGLYSICVTDDGCRAIYQCATAPDCAGDTTGNCVSACITSQPTPSQNLYYNLGICDYEEQCATGASCAATCAPPADYCAPIGDDDSGTVDDAAPPVDSAPPETCQSCQATTCASQLAACAAGTACATYNACVLGCDTEDCTGICASNSPTGLQAAQALGTCTTTACPICSQ